MTFQVWIQTQKENVQNVKLILEEAGQLNKVQKVKPGAQDGEQFSSKINAFTDDEKGT
jgi:hypothetical protein